jgi:hypothetical protein
LTKGKLQPRHYIPRIADTMEWIEPTAPAANFATIEAARLETENLIDDFLNPNVFIRYVIWLSENRSYPHIASALRIDTGVGKTSIAVKKITRSSNKTIVFAVPTLELADRVAQQFVNLGVVAPVFRGMNADDPENPGEEMCLNPDAVALALKVMAKVSSSCCKNKEDQCEFFESCGYQSQIARVKQDKRRVIIVAADMLFHENTTIGTPYGVVIDESSWQKQLRGIDDDERFFMPFSMMRKHGMLHTHLADELSKQQESGGLRRRFIDGMDNLTNLINEQWKQKPDIGLRPGMSKRQIERLKKSELIDEAVYSRQIIEIIKELRQMFDDPEIESSGRLLLDEKDGQRGIRWRGVAPIAKQYRRPTLILDATLPDLSVLRVTHPGAEIDSDISVALPPCVSVRQVIAAPTSSSKLINSDAKKPERHRESLRRYILRRRIETGKELTLVICQMEVEEWLRKRLPKEIQLAHFNAIAGLDIYRDVRLIILAGRVQPGPEAVEVRAATLSGAMPIKILTKANGFEWFDQVRRGIRLRDGSGIAVKGDQHPDEFCEAIRWQICEAELVQAFGRARAINRTEETPLDVDLLFNTVLPPLQGNNKRS